MIAVYDESREAHWSRGFMGVEIISGTKGERKQVITVIETRTNATFDVPTDTEQDFCEGDPAQFLFRIDKTYTSQAGRIVLPVRKLIVWDRTAEEFVDVVTAGDDRQFDHGHYNLELPTSPMKLFFAVESAFTVEAEYNQITLDFESTTRLAVGARSRHKTPATVIEVSDDTADLMAAISCFGAAITTDDPTRSYATLRDHPPLIERGDALQIPADLDPPETGIELRVPPTEAYVYPIAPLAYYLGATVAPVASDESDPLLTTADGWAYPLTAADNYEATVNRVLKQVFFLDCVTRTGQRFGWGLEERDAVAADLDLPLDALYDQSLARRIRQYLEVPYAEIADAIPTWPLTVDIEPTVARAELLPYVAHELAHVRTISSPGQYQTVRGASSAGGNRQSSIGYFGPELVDPEPVETVEHAWAANLHPLDANKLSAEACRATASGQLTDTPQTKLVVVNNRTDGGAIDDYYERANWSNVEFEFADNVSRTELREVLSNPAGLFHYIGSVTDEGFECTDGFLDAGSLVEAGPATFLLNGCQSFHQAATLVAKGCHAGVASLGASPAPEAAPFGIGVGKLLLTGFSMRAAVPNAARVTGFSNPYTILGNGGITVRQGNTSGCPACVKIEPAPGGNYQVTVNAHVGPGFRLGTLFKDKFDHLSTWTLAPATVGPTTVSKEKLIDEISQEMMPVEWQGQIYLSDEILLGELFGSEPRL